MALVVKHAKVNNIPAWTQADLDIQIALGNFPPGTLISDITLSTDWNSLHFITGFVDPIYRDITSDTALANADDTTIFYNTGATSIVNIDFSAITPIKSFQFIVMDANGISLLPGPFTFYLAGQVISGAVSSTTVGSVIKATVMSATQIILQADGAWEYP